MFLLFYNVCHLKIKMPNDFFFGVRAAGWHQAFNYSFLQRELEVYVVVCLLHSSQLHLFSWDENENTMAKTSDAEKHGIFNHTSLWQIWLNISVLLCENVFPGLFFPDRSLRSKGSKEGAAAVRHRGQRGFDQRLDDCANRCKDWNPNGVGVIGVL